MEDNRHIKSYVLRASRMSKAQKNAIENFTDKHCIEFTAETLDYSQYFKTDEICIEIGFGMGKATVAIAEKNPETGFIGIEVHKPGVGKLIAEIEKRNLTNLKVINHDAVEVLKTMIPNSSVSGFHIFFPDPWQKLRHHKRRLINTEFARCLIQKLKPGGYIYTATDWENYAEQMLQVFSNEEKLINQFPDWADSPVWRPETAFENKGLKKDHIIRELFFKLSGKS